MLTEVKFFVNKQALLKHLYLIYQNTSLRFPKYQEYCSQRV